MSDRRAVIERHFIELRRQIEAVPELAGLADALLLEYAVQLLAERSERDLRFGADADVVTVAEAGRAVELACRPLLARIASLLDRIEAGR